MEKQRIPTLQESLTHSLSQLSCNENFEWNKVCICKRSRELRQGEFVIPKGSCPKFVEANPSVLLNYIQSDISQLQNVDLPCETIDSDKFNHLRLHVNRAKSFRNVIAKVLKEEKNYGHIKSESSTRVALSLSDLSCNTKEEVVLTPSSLRQLLILQHVQQLLTAHGYPTRQLPVKKSPQVEGVSSSLGLEISTDNYPKDSDKLQTIVSRLKKSKFREILHRGGKGDNSTSETESVVINLRQFIEESGYCTGKLAFDKNLHFVDVSDDEGPNEVIESVARLQSCQAGEQVVHIVSEGRCYTQQQVDLLWRMEAGETEGGETRKEDSLPVNQSHLVLGSVTGRAGQHCSLTAQEFIQMRFEQMKEASVMKYGDEVTGEGWETTLSGMTTASVAFEMLNTASRNTVKLDLSTEDQLGAEMRSGAFVMYNCARLSTLFRRFNDEVKKGVYPPLPDIDEVNFDLLKEEEEWELLFNYVYSYPDVLYQCVERVHSTDTDIHAKIHTHKISNFLINFSRSLSSYYSRIHILGDGRSHLLPVMYARLHLMKAVHQVLENGLHLMGIQPPSQL